MKPDSDTNDHVVPSQRSDVDVCVIGAGAAGFKAAYEAAHAGASVVLLERNERSGKKILISGGGKCNITNTHVDLSRYHGTHPRFVQDALRAYTNEDLRAWLDELGVPTVEGEKYGKVWPESMMSKTVVAALEEGLASVNAELHVSRDVVSVAKDEDSFRMTTRQDFTYTCRSLVLSCGGLSAPHLGAVGTGLDIAQDLGHTLVTPYPALAGLHISDPWVMELQGLTCDDVEIDLVIDGKEVLRVEGALLFTHYGVNSPAIFRLSREVEPALDAGKAVALRVNFCPDARRTREDIQRLIYETLGANTKKRAGTVVGYIVGYRRLGDLFVKLAGSDPEKRVRELQKKHRDELEALIYSSTLNVSGTQGWKRAEVMRGGIDVRGVDPKTMTSKKCPGLFLCGEMLDVDGDVGGFNFQFAFASGHLAGASAASHALA